MSWIHEHAAGWVYGTWRIDGSIIMGSVWLPPIEHMDISYERRSSRVNCCGTLPSPLRDIMLIFAYGSGTRSQKRLF